MYLLSLALNSTRRQQPALVLLATLLASTLAACSSPGPRVTPPAAPHAAAGHGGAAQIVRVARRQVGVPYRYGGRSPRTGFDCSGLVYYSHRQAGIAVPRTTRALYRRAAPVSRAGLRPGDLVFFRVNTPRVGHVGIYLGGGRFVHAPSSGKRVAIETMSNPYWKARFLGGGRI